MQKRIDKVRKLVLPEAWDFCPGRLNPADLPTRGINATDLKDNETCWYKLRSLHLPPDGCREQPLIRTPYGHIQDELLSN